HSPTKDPSVRIEMIDTAGKLKIPFTTGLLLGIGESREDRIESLETIKELYLRHRHIQEVIIQNFCPKPGTDMAGIPGASVEILSDTLQLAADILPKEISIQIPPNLSDAGRILQYGVTDLGGVSPVTIDYINPEHPWPALDELQRLVSSAGFTLAERLCVYEKYCNAEWIDERVLPVAEALKKKVYG
ncbi:MAG TPA: 7,8-didemethyl-8-hydroxy-5-deazariboflavin synthase subunit CofG, partial [Methanocorpusculum sp.]|nr:7,8-didemethyl-8-hydroxy-5-deazariboflavin synthase subunit CofG [Methanocorpusculum sp.]